MGRSVSDSKRKARVGAGVIVANQWIEDTFTKTHPLLGAIRRHLVEAIAANNAEREHHFIHPSEMAKSDWCPRASWYKITGAPGEAEDVGFSLANIFLEGHEIHDKYQTWFWDMGILEGMWACHRCAHRWWGLSPVECPSCGQAKWGLRYAEVPIYISDLSAFGHADGIIILDDKRYLIEIKSIGLRSIQMERPSIYEEYAEHKDLARLWSSINVPFPSHVRQGSLYCRGAEVPEIIYIYEFKANQQQKMFTVTYRESTLRHIIPGANAVTRALENKHETVERPAWADDPTCKTCRSCPFTEHCWKGAEEAA